jgi:uncharacterized protein YgiM (DUF1202 family)
MSGKKNYNKISTEKTKATSDVVEEAAAELVETIDDAVVEEESLVIGTVVNCLKLNVRKDKNINSKVVHVLDAGAKVSVDLKDSTSDWYNVYVDLGEQGCLGYCMKKYISVE